MIVCCGEALIDMVPSESAEGLELFEPKAGGCPCNTAVAAARLGSSVGFLGRVGNDFFGDRLLARLRENGVDTRFVKRTDEPATLAFVSGNPDGGARYAFYSSAAADRNLAIDDLPPSFDTETRFLMLGSISLAQEPSGTTIESLAAREASKRLISFDPNIRERLIIDRAGYMERFGRIAGMSAIVKTSSEDLAWLFPGVAIDECVDRLLALGPELVVVTTGAAGSIAQTRGARGQAAGPKVKVIDTIGAGDAFHAALLHPLDGRGIADRGSLGSLATADLESLLTFSNRVAAFNCTRAGAEPPTIEELASFALVDPKRRRIGRLSVHREERG